MRGEISRADALIERIQDGGHRFANQMILYGSPSGLPSPEIS
jgi:hypothetical protein